MVSFKPDYQRRKPPRHSYIRQFIPYIALLVFFSAFLSSLGLLSHFSSPARKQQIGWQSWDVVEADRKNSSGGSGAGQGGAGDESFIPSIPLDRWDPLAQHTTGRESEARRPGYVVGLFDKLIDVVTEIAVKPCYLSPILFPSFCAPPTTPEEDKAKGRWVVVHPDLNVRSGLWYLNVYYRRTRRLDVPLITDIKILPDPPAEKDMPSKQDGWVEAKGNVRSGVWPTQPDAKLWYQLKDQGWGSSKVKRNDTAPISRSARQYMMEEDFITEVDVLYGDGEPFFGFDRSAGEKVVESKADTWEAVDIVYRRGNPTLPTISQPRFHADGTFKIMQIADLHYSVGVGECKETDKQPCEGDPDTEAWLAEALDAEQPDLVVFSGDQLNGQGTSYSSRSVLAKFAKPVIDRQIPWCAIFGNHDSEVHGDRAEQMRHLQNMPYSLAQAGPEDVDGVGNYLVKIHSHDLSHIHLFTLYFLDSHDYQKKAFPWSKPEYDYIKTSQIEWYLNASAHIQPIERPFTPDGSSDLDKVWKSRSRATPFNPTRPQPRAERSLAKPNAIMWFHIPLPESYNDADTSGFDGDPLDVGDMFDWPGNSKHNSGFFYNAVKSSFEVDASEPGESWLGGKQVAEVKVLGHGHSHNTDRCRRVDGIWICFDGGSSYSGYGQLGFDRRVRVYQLSDYGEKVETYKRLTTGEIIDKQILVGEGAPPGAGQDQSAVNW